MSNPSPAPSSACRPQFLRARLIVCVPPRQHTAYPPLCTLVRPIYSPKVEYESLFPPLSCLTRLTVITQWLFRVLRTFPHACVQPCSLILSQCTCTSGIPDCL
eukprot:scaffold285613_cov32-Tisochrysis_lutea.AAC.2